MAELHHRAKEIPTVDDDVFEISARVRTRSAAIRTDGLSSTMTTINTSRGGSVYRVLEA
jgi:hypothetical protein